MQEATRRINELMSELQRVFDVLAMTTTTMPYTHTGTRKEQPKD